MGKKDLSIEYNAKKIKLIDKLNTLSNVGILVDEYWKKLEGIETQLQDDLSKSDPMSIFEYSKNYETIYIKAIVALEEIEGLISKYSSYIEGFYYCDYLKEKLGVGTSKDEADLYATKMISIINMINETDTRAYEEEKEVVEKIYSLAYQIMKLEFAVSGKSKIYELAKKDAIVDSYLNTEIASELENLDKKTRESSAVKSCIAKIRSKGIDYSYVDQSLLITLSMGDSDSCTNGIRRQLERLLAQIEENYREMKSISRDIKDDKKQVDYVDGELKENRKELSVGILKRIIAGILPIAMVFGIYQGARALSTKKQYSTKKETYSVSGGYTQEDLYANKSGEFHSLQHITYEPYEKTLGRFERTVRTYNITNIEEEGKPLEFYLSVDLEKAGKDSKEYQTKSKQDMTLDDYYNESIVEIVKIIQNPEDYIVVEEKGNAILITTFISIVILAIYFGVIYCMGIDGFFEIDTNCYDKDDMKKALLKVKTKLERFKQLMQDNEELKAKFKEMFEAYKEVLSTPEMMEKVIRVDKLIEIPDPAIELSAREKRLVRNVK